MQRTCCSQLPEESHEIRFVVFCELQTLNQVEEFDHVLERQTAAIVQIRRAIFDSSQRESLDWAVACFLLEEPLDMQVMHIVIEVERSRVTGSALGLPKEKRFAPQLVRRGLFRVEVAGEGQLRRGREVK